METEFLFVIDGVSIDDDEAMSTLSDEFDAIVAFHRGTLRLAISAEGIDPVNALSGLLVRLARHLPDCVSFAWTPTWSGFRTSPTASAGPGRTSSSGSTVSARPERAPFPSRKVQPVAH